MMKRHEIQVLLRAGLSQTKVAELAAVSERTVRTIADEASVVEIGDAAEIARRGIGRRRWPSRSGHSSGACSNRNQICFHWSCCAAPSCRATRVARRRSTIWSLHCGRR
jgi:hypothetical protein